MISPPIPDPRDITVPALSKLLKDVIAEIADFNKSLVALKKQNDKPDKMEDGL